MRTFLIRLAIFIAIATAVFVSLAAFTFAYSTRGTLFQVPNGTHSIILGHSQSACAFDDDYIPGCYNLSQFTEGYPYSFFKAKKILENNPQVENIFVEFTNNQIGYWAKERIHGTYMKINMERMLPVLDKSFVMKTFLSSGSLSEVSLSLYSSFRMCLGFVFTDQENYIEAIWHNQKAPDHKFDGDTNVVLNKSADFVNILDLQEENIRYLFRLKDLCKKYGVRLYFVRSPLPFHMRKMNVNEPFLSLIREVYFSDVPFLDFSRFPVGLHYFADNSHLNLEGSRLFSRFFSDSVVPMLADSDIERKIGIMLKDLEDGK